MAECVNQICIAVSCLAPVSESLGIISEMEEFQRALWETEAQREAKERRVRLERRQRARLKLERSRQELEDRVRRRQEARREERGVRVAAPMVVMRRNKQAAASAANPNKPGTGLRAHHEATIAATAQPHSRLPFANATGSSIQHSAAPGMRPPSREHNVGTLDLASSVDQNLAWLRAQAMAMAHDAGCAPTDMTATLPEMTGANSGAGKATPGRGGWPNNAELNPRLSAGLARAQQNDLVTAEQQRHGRGGVFARNLPPEKSEGGVLALTPRVGGESSSGSGSGRSGRETHANHGLPGAGQSSIGRGLGHGRSRGGGVGRGARHMNGTVKVAARCVTVPGTGNEYGLTSSGYTANGADDTSDLAPASSGLMLSQRGRDPVQMQQLPNRRGNSGLDIRAAVSRDKHRGDFQGTGSRPNSGQELDPAWRLGIDGSTPSDAASVASAAASVEALRREELYWIQHENTRLLRELAEPRGVDHTPNSATDSSTAARSPAPRAENIDGSPFYQFKLPLRHSPGIADGSESSQRNSNLTSQGAQGRVNTASQPQQSGDVDRIYDCVGGTRRHSSSDSDGSDMDAPTGNNLGPASASSAGLVGARGLGPGDDLKHGTEACDHRQKSNIEPPTNASTQPQAGAVGPKKRLTAAEVRASTRGSWPGIRGLLAEHGAIGISGQGLSQAARGSDKQDDTTEGGAGRWQENRSELDNHSQVQTRLGEIHAMVLDTVRWEKKKERRAEARDERKSTFRSASLDVASRAFERGRPDLLYSSQFR